MSKKKRSKKRERIPVIDTLIDLAGAMTLDYLAAKRRQKYGTKRSKKIDPYAATGAAMGITTRSLQRCFINGIATLSRNTVKSPMQGLL